jgi:hypothetical protein
VIVRSLPTLTLVDRAAAAALRQRPVRTIRRHAQAIACDVRTRAALYDLADIEATDERVTRRIRRAS